MSNPNINKSRLVQGEESIVAYLRGKKIKKKQVKKDIRGSRNLK